MLLTNRQGSCGLAEQLGIGTAANEYHQTVLASVIERVDEQEVAANMTLEVPVPVTRQRVIEPMV